MYRKFVCNMLKSLLILISSSLSSIYSSGYFKSNVEEETREGEESAGGKRQMARWRLRGGQDPWGRAMEKEVGRRKRRRRRRSGKIVKFDQLWFCFHCRPWERSGQMEIWEGRSKWTRTKSQRKVGELDEFRCSEVIQFLVLDRDCSIQIRDNPFLNTSRVTN